MTSKNRVAENVHRQNNKDLHLQRNSLTEHIEEDLFRKCLLLLMESSK